MELFRSTNVVVWIPAATLGHHALEMGLKAALISESLTVFNPKHIARLDPSVGLLSENCVWGHELIPLAERLAQKRNDFDLDLDLDLNLPTLVVLDSPRTFRDGLEIFEPFFSELRYPVATRDLIGVGPGVSSLLRRLFEILRPFFPSEIGNE
jgi:hypothetical protein